MARNGQVSKGTTAVAMRRMADADPELAARLILQSLPAAAAGLPAGLSYRLELENLGAWRVESRGDRAEVSEVDGGGDLNGEAFAISTDARTLARLAAGGNPIGALARGRLKLRGKRRKALALRGLSQDAGPRDLARLGLPVDPDLLFRSLAYAIDPEWTRGHRFTVGYELVGRGRWQLARRGGRRAHRHAGPGSETSRTPWCGSATRTGCGCSPARSPRRRRCGWG